jgi:hypothetical protein
MQLYLWDRLCWEFINHSNGRNTAIAHCPKKNCHSRLKESEINRLPFYNFKCLKCDFEIVSKDSMDLKSFHAAQVIDSLKYKDAEIINIDGDLVRVQREGIKDNDYWIDAKISKNNKGELQLMLLAGSKKEGDKTQLFLEPKTERLAFDQNNDHPTKIFAKVIAIFKKSACEIST